MDKTYSKKEEIFNTLSHGLGAFLSLVGMVILIISALPNILLTVSVIIYCFTMFLMYFSSTIYHGSQNIIRKKHYKTLDHCAIFLLIAGTYTPFTLITLSGSIGYTLLVVIWIFAIIGVILNIIDVKKYSKLSLVCYVVMGWAVVFAMKPLIHALDVGGLLLLLLGGLSYTIGILFYITKRKYMHTVWHFFVLLGSIFHYCAVLFYVI